MADAIGSAPSNLPLGANYLDTPATFQVAGAAGTNQQLTSTYATVGNLSITPSQAGIYLVFASLDVTWIDQDATNKYPVRINMKTGYGFLTGNTVQHYFPSVSNTRIPLQTFATIDHDGSTTMYVQAQALKDDGTSPTAADCLCYKSSSVLVAWKLST